MGRELGGGVGSEASQRRVAIEWQGRGGEGSGVGALNGAAGGEQEGGCEGKESGEQDGGVDCRGHEAACDGSDLRQ